MTIDGRCQAWAMAWQLTQHAEKLRTDPESPPDIYWGWLAEAKIYAELATADLSVGISVGAWLSAEEKREAESLVHREDFEEMMERRKGENTTPTYAPGTTVRVVGGEDWMNGEPAVVKKWDGSKYQVLVRNQSGAPWYVWLTPAQVNQPQEDT